MYRGWLRIFARAEGYYGFDFQIFRGATQGEPLYSTIINVVVDAVVRHWVEVMGEGKGGQERNEQDGRHKNSLFYADDGMLASSDPG